MRGKEIKVSNISPDEWAAICRASSLAGLRPATWSRLRLLDAAFQEVQNHEAGDMLSPRVVHFRGNAICGCPICRPDSAVC